MSLIHTFTDIEIMSLILPKSPFTNKLNLLVQGDLNKIRHIIFNIRESVKYVELYDARLKAFSDVVEQKCL